MENGPQRCEGKSRKVNQAFKAEEMKYGTIR